MGPMPLGLPSFSGATRRLVLANVITYFALAVLGLASAASAGKIADYLSFIPSLFLHGAIWQPLTYSFIHQGILQTAFELLSLWFLAAFLEAYRAG
jgi:membrane associated rhomboid family serine protease